jgi:aerobic carbon-monoxide dehydrogenase large subunit
MRLRPLRENAVEQVLSKSSDGLIGKSVARPQAQRAVSGRGYYTDDIVAAGMAHAVFLRSPHAHARIGKVDLEAVRSAPGVIAAFSGADLAKICKPWQTRLALLPGHYSAAQPAMAIDESCWQGEAVAIVVAESRAQAEDSLELVQIEWDGLPAVVDPEGALAQDAPLAHGDLQSNLAVDHIIEKGDLAAAFDNAATIVEHKFHFGRQTGVTLEPRSVLATFDRRTELLTVYQSTQVPFQMREIYAEQLGLHPDQVRVIVPDVGGAFGLKLHAYADEIAVVATAMLVGRPIRFTADRLESFVSDSHAREAIATARMAVGKDGMISGLEVDLIGGFGAYSIYPRSSIGEIMQTIQLVGACYEFPAYRGRMRGAYQNKPPSGAYRGVGEPLAMAITEQMIELGAAAIGMDPLEFRRRNYRKTSREPTTTTAGVVLEELSLQTCQHKLIERMNYDELRREQTTLRNRGVYRGIGLSAFIEMSAGPSLYGPQGIKIAGHEACRLRLEGSGRIQAFSSSTDQGQGIATGISQVIAAEFGIPFDAVRITCGDTSLTPYGSGAWASRGMSYGGEAALLAARQLRSNVLTIAASLVHVNAADLRIENGIIYDAKGVERTTVANVAATAYYRPHQIPLGLVPPLEIQELFFAKNVPYLSGNGIQAALVEVDIGTGLVSLLKCWVVDDCGRVINPQLVDEQIRGGLVQAIGGALYEHCVYSNDGQLLNGTLADYLLPMAGEMPDIDVLHVSTPTFSTQLGAKGVGEAGTIGGLGCIWTAVNDALRPLGARVTHQPFTPEHILDCIAAASSGKAR